MTSAERARTAPRRIQIRWARVAVLLHHAATDAAGDGVEFVVESGWRSPQHQARLLGGAYG